MVVSMNRVLHGLCALVVFATAFAAALVAPAPVRADAAMEIVYDDGRAPEQIPLLRVSGDDAWFVRAGDAARLLRATQFWNASSRKIVLGVGKARIVLTVDTRVVVVDGEPVMMRTNVRYDDGAVLVPLEFILETAAQYTPRGFSWDEEHRRLSVGGVGYNVTQVSFSTAGGGTTVTLHLTEPLIYHVDTATPGLVRVKLYGGRVDLRALNVREGRGLVDGVRAEQSERDAFVTLDVSRDATRLRVDRQDDPPQLDIVLEKGGAGEEGAEGTIQIVEGEGEQRTTFSIDRVCIDAGHGGRENGKESADGVLEKDVNLAIARAVRDRIQEDLGLEVVMTRDDDRMVGLVERTEIANTSGCDLFISIHCNSWFHSGTSGFESYFLSPARSESEKALQRFENQAGEGAARAPRGDVEFILWDLVQNAYIDESSSFAEYIQREMTSRLGIESRGVKQAGFVVLQGAKMPAVLIETAFLSNPQEERLLVDPAFQRRVAEGVVASIRKMQDRYR